ncbi:MAG TPA: dTDP-4-dehydrorhamnose 3,5-epimerase family protein [Actinomycetes bacterium]|nr:dTDP-4-dehydrorhamnose 3,5-epimerase family protein [Actinomycetes bacterium]
MEKLSIDGAYLFRPRIHADERGQFLEWFRAAGFLGDLGHRFELHQANLSVSRRGTIRGVHFADVPPGQAKYLVCVSGTVLDVVVDIRLGSFTFGQVDAVELEGDRRHAVYLAEGLGHAFMALTDDATLVYLCSQPFAPEREHGINPLDPALGIAWPAEIPPLLSAKDAAAPTLAQAAEAGLLPDYQTCLAYQQSLR